MLDNLKLGYGGTKSEMERLILDAEKLDSSFQATRDENGELAMSYADIVDAIHIVQTEMDITGTTAKEASTTISGSISSMKASWQNLLVGIADENADFEALTSNFVDSVMTVGENIIPRVQVIMDGLGTLITEAADKLMPIIVDTLTNNAPQLISSGVKLIMALITGLVRAIPSLVRSIPQIVAAIAQALKEAWPEIKEAGSELLSMLGEGISVALGKAKEWGAEIINNLKAGVTASAGKLLDKFQGIVDSIKAKFDSIKAKIDQIKSKFEDLKNKVSGIGEAIKNFFSGEVSLPHIPLPHFKIMPEGWKIKDLLQGIKPELSIEWYKKAYDMPYMFTQPTVMAGFGDGNGGEMVYGHDSLMRDIRDAVGNNNDPRLDHIIDLLEEIVQNGLNANISRSQVYRSVSEENRVRTKATNYNVLAARA